MNFGNKLSLSRKTRTPFGVKGERKDYVVSVPYLPAIVPSGYNKISIKLPKGEADMLIVPGSMKLVFEFNITGDDDSWPVNNLAANLVKEILIKWGRKELLKIKNFDVLQTYKDLWLTLNQRNNLIRRGIQSTNISKLRSGAKSGNENALDTQIKRVLNNKYEIPLDCTFLSDQHPFYPYIYNEDIWIDLHLQSPKLVINSTNTSAVTDYNLSNISFEYSTIYEPQLANQIAQLSDSPHGITYLYDYISNISFVDTIKQSDKSFILSIQDKRRSVRGILLLFTLSPATANRDSENFYNPQITTVDISINGTTHKIFLDGYKEDQMFYEAKKLFLNEYRKNDDNSNVLMQTFYGSQYCLWIDTRSTEDNNLHGSGMKIEDGFNIALTVTKNNTGSGDINVYPYLIADAQFTLLHRSATDVVH